MSSQKQTVHQVAASEAAPAGAGFGSTLTFADRAAFEQRARYERAVTIGGWVGGGIAKLVDVVRAAHRRRVAMAELSALDNRMLADIGISRSEIAGAVASASGFMPRSLGTSATARSLNDDSVRRTA